MLDWRFASMDRFANRFANRFAFGSAPTTTAWSTDRTRKPWPLNQAEDTTKRLHIGKARTVGLKRPCRRYRASPAVRRLGIVLSRCADAQVRLPVNPSFAGHSHCKPRTVSGLDHNGIRNPELRAAWSSSSCKCRASRLAFKSGAKPELSSGMCRVCTQGIWWRRFGVSFHESNPKPLIALNFIQ